MEYREDRRVYLVVNCKPCKGKITLDGKIVRFEKRGVGLTLAAS